MRGFPVRRLIAGIAATVLIGGVCAFAFATRPSSRCGEEYDKGYGKDPKSQDHLRTALSHSVGPSPVSPTAVNSRNDHQPVAEKTKLPGEFPHKVPALIGTLQSRYHTVRVHAGLRYSVADASGETLATLISDDELADQLPGLFSDLKHGLAGSTLWAGW